MSMRRPEARAKRPLHLEVSEFGWNPSVVASFRHTSLPWTDSPATTSWNLHGRPLSECRASGKRDLLSLVGQYAAHLAWLRFCGLSDSCFVPEEWIVESHRGEDCRLLRIRAPREQSSDDFVPLTLIQAFSSYLGLPDLDVFAQTCAKPDAVYHEVHRRLRGEPLAATAWLRKAASGVVLTPGPESLERVLLEPVRYRYEDDSLLESFTAANALGGVNRFFVMGGSAASPLVAWSAAASLGSIAESLEGDAGRVAESVIASAQANPIAIAVTRLETFDVFSRNLLAILLGHRESISWMVPVTSDALLARVDATAVEGSRFFVVSPRLEPLKQLRSAMSRIDASRRREWISHWVEGPSFDAFLDDGIVDIESAEWQVEEPVRSYIAALALMGDELEEGVCCEFLERLGCHLPLAELCGAKVLGLSEGVIRFSSADCQRYFARQVPAATRPALYTLAASVLDAAGGEGAADLYILAGNREKARELLERDRSRAELSWQATLSALETIPEEVIRSSALLSGRICRALISAGQYRRAEGFANALEDRDRNVLLARIHRRRGNYRAALTLLGPRIEPAAHSPHDLERLLLMGELLRLTGDLAGAESCFAKCRSLARTPRDAEKVAFENAMLLIDQGRQPDELAGTSHLALRLRAYSGLIALDYASATADAEAALLIAPDVPAAIDASLDLMNAHFLAGRWEVARYKAREALALVEETEGDRGSGGILFLLAYLCADGGQWKQAREKIDRLRKFYSGTGDDSRLGEVNLIVAHLALADGEAKSARRTAAGLLGDGIPHDIREAAALIVDEANWMEGSLDVLCSTGKTECRGLRDWHLVQRARVTGRAQEGVEGEIWRAIIDTELNPAATVRELEAFADSSSEKLRALRSAIGLAHRRSDPAIRGWIAKLAAELGCSFVGELKSLEPAAPEVNVLHQLAAGEFPFSSMKVADRDWRYASRNRLDSWNQAGSLEPLAGERLDEILAAPSESWRSAGERSLVFVEGLETWPAASQAAVVNLLILRAEHHALRNLLAEEERGSIADAPSATGIVGDSHAIREVTDRIARLSRSEAGICILGESGTGKELVARAIHKQSSRRGRIFTPINCAALPDALVESELFGHVRGAYTGADRDHAGLIESTDGGTLFLDEIGELPLQAQSKLLRFLQEGEYRRVGDTEVRRSDVRIVAATNRELETAVDEGRFREDLFYRINVIEVRVPPLRDRGSDIILLARFFLEQERSRQRSGPEKFTDEVELVLLSHNWPGNVRELQNAVKASYAIAGDSRRIGLDHLPERLRGVLVRNASTGSYFEELNRFRKSLVEQSLVSAAGNQNQAAKLLGISRQALAYQIRELGILVNDPAVRRRRM